MMQQHERVRLSSIAWHAVVLALTVCFITFLAALVGHASAAAVSLVSFGGTFIGCVAAAMYLYATIREDAGNEAMPWGIRWRGRGCSRPKRSKSGP